VTAPYQVYRTGDKARQEELTIKAQRSEEEKILVTLGGFVTLWLHSSVFTSRRKSFTTKAQRREEEKILVTSWWLRDFVVNALSASLSIHRLPPRCLL
jgi:hypothetical protein